MDCVFIDSKYSAETHLHVVQQGCTWPLELDLSLSRRQVVTHEAMFRSPDLGPLAAHIVRLVVDNVRGRRHVPPVVAICRNEDAKTGRLACIPNAQGESVQFESVRPTYVSQSPCWPLTR